MSIFDVGWKSLTQVPRGRSVSARIISDGCRDYLVGIEQEGGTEILMDCRGRPRRFASLAEARRVLRRANISDIKLVVRVAADEACARSALQGSGFSAVKMN